MLMHHPLTVRQIPTVQPAIAPAPRLHVAIISDGNGRWATSRGLPRSAGHRAGAEAARRVIEAAARVGIHTLTLFALSSANWKRPTAEVQAILRLLHEYLLTETTHCIDEGVRLSIIGRRDRLPAALRSRWIIPPAKPSIMPPAAFIKSPSFLPSPSAACLRKSTAGARRKSIC